MLHGRRRLTLQACQNACVWNVFGKLDGDVSTDYRLVRKGLETPQPAFCASSSMLMLKAIGAAGKSYFRCSRGCSSPSHPTA
jgi:hypothetical protein